GVTRDKLLPRIIDTPFMALQNLDFSVLCCNLCVTHTLESRSSIILLWVLSSASLPPAVPLAHRCESPIPPACPLPPRDRPWVCRAPWCEPGLSLNLLESNTGGCGS